MNARLLQIEREQRVQFERIAQIQQQLDERVRRVKPAEKPRRRRG